MTLDRDLDRRLVVWLDERAVASPPEDLLARSLARVDATRQRRGWTFPGVVLSGSATVGRRPVPAWAILVAVAIALAALIVVGDQIVRRYFAVVPPQTPLPTLASLAPSQTPLPLDTRAPALPAQAGTFAETQQMAAFGDKVVWVATQSAVYRTEDGGSTWRAVQPDAWTRPLSEQFVDADTAYVPIGSGSEIAATHDGGASWVTTVLDAPGASQPVFAFSSASTGYVTFVDPSHFDKKDGTGLFVFGTTDGGASWSESSGLQPRVPNQVNKLYPANGPFLISSGTDWFDLSEDGGVHYTRYTFPTGPDAPRKASKYLNQIFRGADGHLRITLDIYADEPHVGYPAFIWRNGDDPSSWTKVAKLPNVAGPLQFLSDSTWVLTGGAPTKILSTTDSGATWRTVIPPMSLYHVQAGFGFVQWTSVDTGWIVDQCLDLTNRGDGKSTGYDCGDRSRDLVVLVTRDGGATWSEIGS